MQLLTCRAPAAVLGSYPIVAIVVGTTMRHPGVSIPENVLDCPTLTRRTNMSRLH